MYPGLLRYANKKLKFACKNFFGKCLFEYKTQFAVEKKIWATQFYLEKFLLWPSEKKRVIQFSFMEIV